MTHNTNTTTNHKFDCASTSFRNNPISATRRLDDDRKVVYEHSLKGDEVRFEMRYEDGNCLSVHKAAIPDGPFAGREWFTASFYPESTAPRVGSGVHTPNTVGKHAGERKIFFYVDELAIHLPTDTARAVMRALSAALDEHEALQIEDFESDPKLAEVLDRQSAADSAEL